MSPALLSLIALVVALVVSMTSRINVGWLGLTFAWLIGLYAGLKPDVVMAGFPTPLFLTLVGVTLLFAIAEANGTLEAIAGRALQASKGNVRVLPWFFFAGACLMSSVGPGAISATALFAPVAMTMGLRAGVPAFLTALMVANGANAGNLSPFSSVGVVASTGMAKAGLVGFPVRVWFANFIAHVLVTVVAYVWFMRRPVEPVPAPPPSGAAAVRAELTSSQWLTIAAIVVWIGAVVGFNMNLGFAAFAAAAILLLAGAADESTAVKRVPWGVVMMVGGVSVLIGMLEKTGGMDLFTDHLARLASPRTVNGMIAFVTGVISTNSSTSGVVLPAFLPTASSLVTKVGGGDPLAIALSINIGSSIVDVSPLSTLGALCVAAVADPVAARKLFRAMLIWGLSMTIVGALLAQVLAPLLAKR